MDIRLTSTYDDKAGDYVLPNVLSPRDLVSRPDNMDETVLHTCCYVKRMSALLSLNATCVTYFRPETDLPEQYPSDTHSQDRGQRGIQMSCL